MYPQIYRRLFYDEWALAVEDHVALQEGLFNHAAGVQLVTTNPNALIVPFSQVAIGAGMKAPVERGSRLWTKGSLGVIPVRGIIGSHMSALETMCGGYGIEQFSADLDLAASDDRLKRVMVDFHSPGGAVVGVPEAAKQFAALGRTKETFSFTSGRSASASYWLMSQANHIYLTESAAVGSIGVYIAGIDRTEQMKQQGLKPIVIKKGEHKAMGFPGVPLTDAQVKLLQDGVDKTYARFTGMITSRRPRVKVESMQGQMFTGADAREAHLVDSLATSFGSLVNRLS